MKRIISVVLCLGLTLSLCGCTKLDYKKAVMLYEGGGYEGAKELFEALGDHENSADYAKKAGEAIDYRNAIELYARENYAEAAAAFEALSGYEDSEEFLDKCREKLMSEKILGRWKTGEIDLTDLLRGYLLQEMAALGYTEVDLSEMEEFKLSAFYSFEKYGVVTETLDESGLPKICEIMVSLTKELMLQTTEQELLAVAEENGISYEELLTNLEVAGIEEYLASVLGMSLDEYLALVYNEDALRPFFAQTAVTGAWYLRDGELFVITGNQTEKGSYDSEKDTITISEARLSEDDSLLSQDETMMIYPYTLTRTLSEAAKA